MTDWLTDQSLANLVLRSVRGHHRQTTRENAVQDLGCRGRVKGDCATPGFISSPPPHSAAALFSGLASKNSETLHCNGSSSLRTVEVLLQPHPSRSGGGAPSFPYQRHAEEVGSWGGCIYLSVIAAKLPPNSQRASPPPPHLIQSFWWSAHRFACTRRAPAKALSSPSC